MLRVQRIESARDRLVDAHFSRTCVDLDHWAAAANTRAEAVMCGVDLVHGGVMGCAFKFHIAGAGAGIEIEGCGASGEIHVARAGGNVPARGRFSCELNIP